MILTMWAGKPPVHLSLLILIFFCTLVLSCKSQAPITSAPAGVKNEQPSPSSKYGNDSVYCLTQTALYREHTSKGRWEAAIVPWRKAFLECPRSGQNLYIDGGNIYRYFIKNTPDSLKKESYADTLFMLYDQRMALFGNTGFVSGRKGIDLLNFRPQEKYTAYECLIKALQEEKIQTQPAVLQSLIITSVDLNRDGLLDTAVVLTTYTRVKDVIFYNLRENIKDTLLYLEANRNIDRIFLPWADCNMLSTTFADQLSTASVAELEEIMHVFELLNCLNNEVFRQATERLHQLKPGPETAFYQGLSAYTNQEYAAALEFFKQAAQQFSDPVKKAACHVATGYTYVSMRNYESAREMAKKAVATDPRCGRAYILIGDIYEASAKNCGNGDQLTEEAVYWAAADQYLIASQVDPSVADEARIKRAACSLHFPQKKLLFFHHLNVGEPYSVGCWIQEKTIIRARQE